MRCRFTNEARGQLGAAASAAERALKNVLTHRSYTHKRHLNTRRLQTRAQLAHAPELLRRTRLRLSQALARVRVTAVAVYTHQLNTRAPPRCEGRGLTGDVQRVVVRHAGALVAGVYLDHHWHVPVVRHGVLLELLQSCGAVDEAE